MFILSPRGRYQRLPRALLLALDGFKQRLEVALAEAAAAFALDDLEEQRGAVFDGPGEDLQHVAFVVAIDEDAQLLQFVERLVDLADAVLQFGVVGVRHAQKLDALLAAAC